MKDGDDERLSLVHKSEVTSWWGRGFQRGVIHIKRPNQIDRDTLA